MNVELMKRFLRAVPDGYDLMDWDGLVIAPEYSSSGALMPSCLFVIYSGDRPSSEFLGLPDGRWKRAGESEWFVGRFGITDDPAYAVHEAMKAHDDGKIDAV